MPTKPPFSTALCLAGALALASAARADRVALPSDGSQAENYPLSLTQLGDWRAVTGTPTAALGKSAGLRSGSALALPPGTVVETVIAVPPLPPHEARFTHRLGVIALDLSGKQGDGQGACTLEVFDETGALLGQAQVVATEPQVGGAGWSSDSEDGSEPLGAALDGKPDSLWHSNWHTPTALPHYLQWSAGQATAITGFVYTPRHNWRTGMVKDWELQASDDGGSWRTLATGTFDYPGRALTAQTVKLKQPATAHAFRFVAKSEATGDKHHASAAEFRFVGADGAPLPVAVPGNHIPARHARAWVCLTPELTAAITPPCLDQPRESAPPPKAPADAKKLRLRVTSTGPATAVVAGVSFTRPPAKVDRGMEAKPNSYGPFGPDYFASGMTGLQGLLNHGETGLSLLEPFPDSPAAKAGLQNGDYLVAVGGVPLNPNFGHQRMGWLEDGHQAAIGRAVVDALRADAKQPRALPLTVLRAGKPVEVALQLPASVPLWQAAAAPSPDVMGWQGPALGDPLWDAMEQDMVAFIEKNQRPDGSFGGGGNNYIQTSWAGLALLQTGDPRHAERIARCADFCLKQPDLMNQWFWKVGYNGIFLAEYYLATGDERVRPWIENALAWLPLGTHVGSRGPGILAPGHGPEGLPYDNKGLIAPALHALLFEALAKHAGMRAPARDFHGQIWNYLDYSYADPARGGDGTVDYSPQHRKPSATEGFSECWARTGLFNAAEMLRGPWPKGAVAGKTMNAHSHLMYGSHAYGMPGGAWGVATLAGYAPTEHEAVVRRHAWDWICAWQPGYGLRVSIPHMGQPYMGWEDLNNPAWLMALGARRHVLHLCGGQKRNWLDVSKVPARAGELRFNITAEGKTVLECWPTGAFVGHSRDGKAPAASVPADDLGQGGVVLAQAFDKPNQTQCVSLPNHPKVRAMVFVQGKPIGDPKWLTIPESKRHWKVLAATGWADPAEALARAALAIDGKSGTQWMTNAGDKPQPFPHQLVIDTGRLHLMSGLVFDRVNFGDFDISSSVDNQTWTKVGTFHWIKPNQADGNHRLTEDLDPPPTPVRYLRLDIRSSATVPAPEGQPARVGNDSLYFGELHVLEPAPAITVKNGTATLAAPAGFELRATTDGSPATADGPPLAVDQAGNATVPLKAGQPLRARCIKGDWVGPEVVEVGK